MAESTQITEKDPKKINWDKISPDVDFCGTKITLPGEPGKMTYDAAIKALQQKKKQDEEVVRVHEFIDAFPYDGLVAIVKAMQQIYGWASPQPTPGFWGPQPPRMLPIRTGPKAHEVISVPFGRFALPGVDNPVNTDFAYDEYDRRSCVLHGEFKRKDVGVVMGIVLKAREIVRNESLYRGRAIQLLLNGDYEVDTSKAPVFMPDLDGAKREELVLNTIEEKQIEASLWTPITRTEACRRNKIPLKRGILLEGRYGIGKSMTARITAKICEENGWTFINLPDVRGLRSALEFARRYAPAVVFAEDIDRAIAERDDLGNDLINVIDGVVGKNDEIITVLTTNHVEKLDRAMLRPGRLDAVIRIKTPDENSAERLITTYARDTLAPKANVRKIAKQLAAANAIPATIREVVERAKLTMLSQDRVEISVDDLEIASTSMVEHLDLLNEKRPEKSQAEQLGEIVLGMFGKRFETVDVLEQRLEYLIEMHE